MNCKKINRSLDPSTYSTLPIFNLQSHLKLTTKHNKTLQQSSSIQLKTMRLLLLTTLLALLATTLVLAATDTEICRSSDRNGDGNRDVTQAINNFCGWTWDLVCTCSLFTSLLPSSPLHNVLLTSLVRSTPSARSAHCSTLANRSRLTDGPLPQIAPWRLQQQRAHPRQHPRRHVPETRVGAAQVLHLAVLPRVRAVRPLRAWRKWAVGLWEERVSEVYHCERLECERIFNDRTIFGVLLRSEWRVW